jgi:hypothetical protein
LGPWRGSAPPGGRLNPGSAALLQAHGYRYVSAAEARPGIASLPFRWPLVDAYHQLPLLRLTVCGRAPRRLRRSALARRIARVVWRRRSASGIRAGRDAMLAALRDASQDVVLIFQPFLLVDDTALAAAADVLAEAAKLDARVCRELV